MKKWKLVPTAIFPYVLVLILAAYFILGNTSEAHFAALKQNMAYIGIGVLAWLLAAIALNVSFMVSAKNADSAALIKTALIIKCIHIPTYVLIYALGIVLGLMFFMTLPVILFLILLDLITLCLSNMISIYAIIKGMKQKGVTVSLVISLICQCFFCADVISLFVLNLIIRKKNHSYIPDEAAEFK